MSDSKENKNIAAISSKELMASASQNGASRLDPDIPVVIYLEPRSRSLSYRPYLDSLGGVPLLTWVSARLLQYAQVTTIVVLYHHAAETRPLQESVDTAYVQIRRTAHFNKLRALAEYATAMEAARIATISLEAALLPADLLRRAIEHHFKSGNTYTRTVGLPAGCDVSVFDQQILAALGELALPAFISDPDEGVERLQLLAQSTGEPLPFRLEHVPFDAAAAYRLDRVKLPLAISLNRRSELKSAECAVQASAARCCDPLSPGLAYTFKEILIQQSGLGISAAAFKQPVPGWKPTRSPGDRARVLYLSSYSAFSGAEESLCSLLRSIDRNRFELLAVLCLEGTFADKLRALGASVTCLERDVYSTTSNFSLLLSLFDQIRPDLIHLNGPERPVFLFAAFALGIPFVQHVRNGDMTGFEDGLLSSSAVIAVSEFLRREALAFPISPEKVSVIYDEVDPWEFRPGIFDKSRARAELNVASDARLALMIARLAPNKRHDLMLRAASILKHRVPGFKLLLKSDAYGDSPFREDPKPYSGIRVRADRPLARLRPGHPHRAGCGRRACALLRTRRTGPLRGGSHVDGDSGRRHRFRRYARDREQRNSRRLRRALRRRRDAGESRCRDPA